MKNAWIILLSLPMMGFSSDDFFYIGDQHTEDLLYYEEETSLADSLGTIEQEELSLYEIGESDQALLPWSLDDLSTKDISSFIEKRAQQLSEEFDEAFAYDLSADTESKEYRPSFEKVPEIKSHLSSRPIPIKTEKN